MMFAVYTAASSLAFLFTAPYFLIKGLRSGKYLWSLRARLGLDPKLPATKTSPRVWVHAVSLGEVISALELVRRLKEEGFDICVSTGTQSGYKIAQERLDPRIPYFYFPLDWPPAVKRLLDFVQPDLFILVETDVWPNFLAELKRRSIPAVLVNGRMSPRTWAGYRLIKPFTRQVLNLFNVMICQSQTDRNRILSLGASPERTYATNSLKYDRPAPKTGPAVRNELLHESGLPDGLWLVGGSTHSGEEEILLDIYKSLLPNYPSLRLLLAPRKRRRFEPVWRQIQKRGLIAARQTGPRPDPNTHVFLLDTQGELDRYYEIADITFIGGSLPGSGPRGGCNLLEPAARSKPILFGPLMYDFHEIAVTMVEAGGGRCVTNAAELKSALIELLDNPEKRSLMGQRAGKAFESQPKALDLIMELISQSMAASPSGKDEAMPGSPDVH